MIHAMMVATSKSKAYMIREEVEFLHEGQAAQHREQAADPQQHAN